MTPRTVSARTDQGATSLGWTDQRRKSQRGDVVAFLMQRKSFDKLRFLEGSDFGKGVMWTHVGAKHRGRSPGWLTGLDVLFRRRKLAVYE